MESALTFMFNHGGKGRENNREAAIIFSNREP